MQGQKAKTALTMEYMFEELRQRNVHRVALAYLAGAWLLVQVVETLTPAFLPSVVFRTTVIGLAIGFVPALILAWKFEWTRDGIQRDVAGSTGTPGSNSRLFDRVVTVVLVAAVAYFAVDKFIFDPARDEAEVMAASEQATKRALSGAFLDEFQGRSILVIPFLNMSSDPEQEFFADGISEELLNQLARIEELRVVSRSTSWTFKGKDIDVAGVHRDLDVSHILEGSVRKAGNQVRITAQLIDARTDTHLWSQTYDESLDDIFAIQEDISVEVADRLHLEIFSSKSPHEGVDPRAYDLYLRVPTGSAALSEPEEARHLLEQALAIEPDYLPALYYLAIAIEQSDERSFAEGVPERRRAVMEIVDRMVELAPESVFANNWQAYVAMRWHNDLVAAAPHLEKSMRFANRTDVHTWFIGTMDLLEGIGRYEEAITVGQYWINRDPYCGYCLSRVVRAMSAAGRHKEAALILESQLESRPVTDGMLWNIGVAQLVGGEPEKALHYFDRIPDDSAEIDKAFVRAFALYSLGRLEEFDSILAELLSSYAGPDPNAEGIARLFAWSNQRDKAFEWLERMVADQGEETAMLVKTELYRPIKSDPRWQAFLEKYGAEDKGHLNVRFEPRYPPTLQRAVDALTAR
jgi:TolB-like protein